MATLDKFFKFVVEQSASDLHLSAGAPPIVRIQGSLSSLNLPPFEPLGYKNASVAFTTPNGALTYGIASAFQVTAGSGLGADFSATPTSGTVPLTVTLTNSSLGSFTSQAWSFGDGTTENRRRGGGGGGLAARRGFLRFVFLQGHDNKIFQPTTAPANASKGREFNKAWQIIH